MTANQEKKIYVPQFITPECRQVAGEETGTTAWRTAVKVRDGGVCNGEHVGSYDDTYGGWNRAGKRLTNCGSELKRVSAFGNA